MFVSDFKQVLTTLPTQEDGYDTFMLHIQEGSLFSRVATDFFPVTVFQLHGILSLCNGVTGRDFLL